MAPVPSSFNRNLFHATGSSRAGNLSCTLWARPLLDFQGIAAGSENTRYFIQPGEGANSSNLVERGPVDEMPFFIQLLDVLHDADLPIAALRFARWTGQALQLKGKPALCNRAWRASTFAKPMLGTAHKSVSCWAICMWRPATWLLERKTDRGLDWMLAEGPR